jgi:large subunit ribosomal protein L24e
MKCSFCGKPIKAGTGKMFVKNDGTIYYWCSRRCEVKFAETAKKAHR